ncbi:MAG: hypothetical protein WEB63_04595 [Cucumibacter sp.]
MSSETVAAIRDLLKNCTSEERAIVFRELRPGHQIHEFENVIGAPAETILDALHRAPELTRRMLRGVVADASFRAFIVPALEKAGWKDVTPEGNHSFDYMLGDKKGAISVQVKLQRSRLGAPVNQRGARFGIDQDVFLVETQRTRSGRDGEENTRPYRFGEFDVLAVSMQPSTGRWDQFMYSPGDWLIEAANPGEMATLQPVAATPNETWTNSFEEVADWFRSGLKRKVGASRKQRSR